MSLQQTLPGQITVCKLLKIVLRDIPYIRKQDYNALYSGIDELQKYLEFL